MCDLDMGTFITNRSVDTDEVFTRSAPTVSGDGECRVIIVANDYKSTSCPLTCTLDGKNMSKLLRKCEVTDVTSLYDNQCTKANVLNAISQVGGRCDADDVFIFYYSGHGGNVADKDGDEDDGQDEAYCLVDSRGQTAEKDWLTDDEFSDAIIAAIDPSVRVLVLSDCCHSGTIADLSHSKWGNIHAISISGCTDQQTSGDMGKGGIFTHAMLLALEQLSNTEDEFSVALLYNATIDVDGKVFNSPQDISIASSPAVSPDGMVWPLVPVEEYRAPLSEAQRHSGGKLTADVLEQFGIAGSIGGIINHDAWQDGDLIFSMDDVRAARQCIKGNLKEIKHNCAVM